MAERNDQQEAEGEQESSQDDDSSPGRPKNEISKVEEQETQPALTYEQLLQENLKLKQEMEEKNTEIMQLDQENLKLKDTEIQRNQEFLKIKKEHNDLVKELESLKNTEQMQIMDKTSEGSDKDEKVVKLKKKLLQEKKKIDKLQQENEKLNYEIVEYSSQYNEVQDEKRKLEIKLDDFEIKNHRAIEQQEYAHDHESAGDDHISNVHSMKKDMQKLIEFKNELEILVDQQNTEIGRKSEEMGQLQKELKTHVNQIAHMNEYILDLEKQAKSDEHKFRQAEVRLKKMKKGGNVEMTKKIRDQQNQINILKDMVSGSKKELKTKVINIDKMKKRLNSLEKIGQIHYSLHSGMDSVKSKGRHGKKNSVDPFIEYEDIEKYSSVEKPNHYKSQRYEVPIKEAKEDLEHTGHHNKEQTAHFGKTLEHKSKNMNSSSDYNIKGNTNIASKTPGSKLLNSVSPHKVGLIL